MYRRLLLLFLITIPSSIALCQEVRKDDATLIDLIRLIDRKQEFMEVKEMKIRGLVQAFSQLADHDSTRYLIAKQLYQEYTPYKLDSAIVYAEYSLQLARRYGHAEWITESNLDLAALHFTAGMYIDSYNILQDISSERLPSPLRVKYYDARKRLYKFYSSANHYDDKYEAQSDLYRDSLLHELDPESTQYQIVYAEKLLDHQQLEKAKTILMRLLSQSDEENHERAILCYALATVFRQEGNIPLQRRYLIQSAIYDIKNAIKENAAMQALASLLYETEHIEEAYKCIQSSMEDAIFCNARFRAYEASQIFPIIDSAYQENEAQKKDMLTGFLLLVSVLSIFLALAIIYVYRQMKRINRVREELFEANQRLQELNARLNTTNDALHKTNLEVSSINKDLAEANHIKEAYIGQFLDLCSTYIDKLEHFQTVLKKMVMGGKMDELLKRLKSRDMIEREVKELFSTFDHIFLHIYPNFVEDFNVLLMEEERFVLKNNELLNTELRIFALIRLGITDSSKIAGFLHYSTNTIYSYRTRIRNKARVPREKFDDMVMKIGRISKI
ncbi:DUF6377 domain-containing protein [Sphingobacterium corticibacterium]|uniref:DUF6377 domain-containing protein n=1 Tax=Sphingobacterium corticibacterium TaxID=2484746 RepID=A0A4Q6XUP8_9SPHI|nr:DUF6377 domain-containing protein [Sphingobacterium corticibacterium]RZF60096.1 hypothetical protein EWE74_13330 [Sphingobacterium corticibacterium]